jgi:hypothetical protein
MTINQFKSLSVGDTIFCGSRAERVSNQYIRIIDGEPVSYIELDGHNVEFPQWMAGVFKSSIYNKDLPQLTYADGARMEREAALMLQVAEYPESVPRKFVEESNKVADENFPTPEYESLYS